MQSKNYKSALDNIKNQLDLKSYNSAIDIGCGTGALCNVLYNFGLSVTGIDPAKGMIETAIKKSNKNIEFLQADVLRGLPCKNNSFDIAISSFVAHGMNPMERKKLYSEMNRVAKRLVIIYDYNENRSLITDVAEWLEGGDYFNFIKTIKFELEEFIGNIKIYNMSKRSAMYVHRKI